MAKRAADDKEGGFDVKIVDNNNSVGSNKERKIECPICLMIFREPVQAIPCGHRFCESCLNKHKTTEDEKEFICPLDRSKIQVFPDVGHKRDILDLDVQCQNEGCDETGELRNLEKHLEECPMQIMKCTLKCGIKNILRKEMDHHLEHDCDKNLINCKYSGIGCQFKGRPEILTDHVKENIDEHIFLQVSNQTKEINSLKENIQQMKDKNREQAELIKSLQNKQKELLCPTCPFTFTVKNVSTMIKDKTYQGYLCSDTFSFLNGYRGFLAVRLNGNREKCRNHIGVFFGIQKGPFDDYLKWPMSFGVITIDMCINGECVRRLSWDCSEIPKEVFVKPPGGKSKGSSKFCKHDELPDKIDGDEIKFIVDVTRI